MPYYSSCCNEHRRLTAWLDPVHVCALGDTSATMNCQIWTQICWPFPLPSPPPFSPLSPLSFISIQIGRPASAGGHLNACLGESLPSGAGQQSVQPSRAATCEPFPLLRPSSRYNLQQTRKFPHTRSHRHTLNAKLRPRLGGGHRGILQH